MRSVVIFCAVIIAVGVSIARYADQVIVNPNGSSNGANVVTTKSASPIKVVAAPQRVESAVPAAPPKPALPEIIRMSPSSPRAVLLQSDDHGQFKVEARVDGRRMEFMVDTGASAVAIRASDAAMLGLHPSANDYNVKVQTANGLGRAARARIDVIEIDNIVVRDVIALIQPDDSLKGNLLGMTFLSRIRFMHDRGRLVLEQQ